MKLLYAVWNYWGPGCTYVTFFVCYAVYIVRSMRKMSRAADAAASFWNDDELNEFDGVRR